jgi:hypothetical protein
MKRKSRDATPEREHIVNGGRNKIAFYDVTDNILSPYTGDNIALQWSVGILTYRERLGMSAADTQV